MADFKKAAEIILDLEKDYNSNLSDKGNYYKGEFVGTNRGITPVAYYDHYKETITAAEMKALTKEQALEIYKDYWYFDNIKNQSLAVLLFNGNVHFGVNRAKKILQKILKDNFKIDVELSDIYKNDNLEKINVLQQKTLFDLLKNEYKLRLGKSSQKQFKKGWKNRLNELQYSETKNNIITDTIQAIKMLPANFKNDNIKIGNHKLTKTHVVILAALPFVISGTIVTYLLINKGGKK